MSENSEENKELTPKERRLANLKPFKKGESGNPNGRPQGSLNYKTKMRLAIESVAEEQNLSPEEIEAMVYRVGLKQALKGDWKFYEDYMNRQHNKPVQPSDITSNGETIEGVVILPPKEIDDSKVETTGEAGDSSSK